jgi:hypothetical protein
MGDLNEIFYNHEKDGGCVHPERYRTTFHRALDECELEDVGFIGDPFTWHRGAMRERLDRGVGNQMWRQMHEKAAIIHLQYNHSDHRPLLLYTCYYGEQADVHRPGGKQFKAKWFKEECFREVVQQKWKEMKEAPIDVHARLLAMHNGLHEWDRRVLKIPKKNLCQAQHELDVLMRGPLNPANDQKKQELANLIKNC